MNSYNYYSQNSLFLSKAFFYYTIILIKLLGNIIFFLHLALHCFYQEINILFNAYKEQEKILLLALNFYNYIFFKPSYRSYSMHKRHMHICNWIPDNTLFGDHNNREQRSKLRIPQSSGEKNLPHAVRK